MTACKHPKSEVHVVAYGGEGDILSKWCACCGALWELYGWEGQRSKWRLPDNARKGKP